MTTTKLEASTFEFTGNHICLDFTNTLHNRFNTPRELLNGYADLVRWSQEAAILSDDEAQQLRAAATHSAGAAEQVLQQAIELREAMYRIFSSHISHTEADTDDLAMLNRMFVKAMTKASIHNNGKGFVWDWSRESRHFDRMLWPIARSMSELLTSDTLESVRMCAADDCGWLFLDTSKNHSRRWCDMKSCGNRAKARKYYKKGQTGE